jgi:DNA invertase Pin-like site-specific DNA recombinase
MTPKTPRYVAYCRVSTDKQGRSGLGLEAQQSAVRDYIKSQAGELLAEFVEVESGKIDNRPKLQLAIERARLTHAKLVIAKLDRLSRDAAFLLQLQKSGLPFVAVDMPQADNFMVGVMALVAQMEREAISKRTKAALAARKARGLSLGNPANLARDAAYAKVASDQAKAIAEKRAEGLRGALDDARAAGCESLREIAAHWNGMGIKTARGSTWTPVAVSRVLAYLETEAA